MTGIACAGNWVLDRSKFIKHYPNITGHTTIHKTTSSAGGAALNILMALAKLKVDVPTYGIGLIGKGYRAKELQQLCLAEHINTDYVQLLEGESSYTDAMTLPDGSRTQFHCPGINNIFAPEHVPINELKNKGVKQFYLGHLMILEGMDAQDTEFGTKSAHLLKDVQQAGIETIVDIVSNPSLSYEKLVHPTLPYVDHLICNEFEAGQLTNIQTQDANDTFILEHIKSAAKKIIELGVKKNIIIHMPQGAYCLTTDGKEYFQDSCKIPRNEIVASCGAGDAFAAGVMYGIHENWNMQKALLLGVCAAGSSLTDETNAGGIKPLDETLALAEIW